jgi:hypothetical protein
MARSTSASRAMPSSSLAAWPGPDFYSHCVSLDAIVDRLPANRGGRGVNQARNFHPKRCCGQSRRRPRRRRGANVHTPAPKPNRGCAHQVGVATLKGPRARRTPTGPMLRRPGVRRAGAIAVLNPRRRVLPRDTGVPRSAVCPRVRRRARPPLPARPRLALGRGCRRRPSRIGGPGHR